MSVMSCSRHAVIGAAALWATLVATACVGTLESTPAHDIKEAAPADATEPDASVESSPESEQTPASLASKPEQRLPCGILRILHKRCVKCHSPEAGEGAPMSLLSYADLLAFSKSDPAVQVAKVALSRFHDAAAPMPPYPEAPLDDGELAEWDDWVKGDLQPRWRGDSAECEGVPTYAGGCDAKSLVFKPLCTSAGCHGSVKPATGLDLTSGDLRKRLTGVVSKSRSCAGEVLLDPAAPDSSLLLDKLSKNPSCGNRMPPLPLTMTAEQVECVRSWIAGQ